MTNANIRRRRSIRLRGYDYARQGVYFITLCCHQRACIFGEIVGGEMRLNPAGTAVADCWRAIPHHFPHASLDAFVVMPNHLHGIIVLAGNNRIVDRANIDSPLQNPATTRSPSLTIGSIVRGFKIGATKALRDNGDDSAVWQRNYYEQIIRDEEGLNRVRQYIADNPQRWDEDAENPARPIVPL